MRNFILILSGFLLGKCVSDPDMCASEADADKNNALGNLVNDLEKGLSVSFWINIDDPLSEFTGQVPEENI